MQQNPYLKLLWHDHIVDTESGVVIQEGTRFTASRINNIENGVFDAYELLMKAYAERQRMQIEIEMLGRVKENNGTFFDTLDGQPPKQLTRLMSAAVSQVALVVGATTVKLDAIPFKAGEYVTIYDDEQQETVKIATVTATGITVPALTKVYKKGARVARTNAAFDAIRQQIIYGHWGTLKVSVMEVV
ncbi:hypothetical protein FQ087_18210 [Sporosarcina sp. ANT_H38]|uniref:hypothetical protein n=1 Tax=Sporosarcina sp. ANT_H38 TaxID=2597358 RepID=UPI0011F28C7E|nr:hypothetical protein [Sporosarcina sp. ANT_H38]KAA0944060.1 hypothetical protein FQ087_18210 [Sporosarcina sp. ANT_H38]